MSDEHARRTSHRCQVCDSEEYEKDAGCDECGHYDEYKAKRKTGMPTRRERRLDERFR